MTRTCIITLAVLLLAVALGGFFFGRATIKPVIEGETTRVDTLILRDTFTRYVPTPAHTHTRDTIRIPLKEVVHDTTYVTLPREVKVYEDKRYRAEVSGYQPSLDRIDIFTQTEVVTQHTAQVVKKRARWGIGISAGYGLAINAHDHAFTPAPYIGIGIQYNLISW